MDIKDIGEQQNDNRSTLLDLSKQGLKKIPKNNASSLVKQLNLDENDLSKFENIETYLQIEKLSISKNSLLRMYCVGKLHNLRELNLSHNGIITLEGTKELIHLRHLNLEGNNIKTIEHLHTNTKLEYLNLNGNSINLITDISYLKCLKELHLQGNKLSNLRQCEKYLPASLEVLSLARNNINDLNEISSLVHLSNLNSITLSQNPCVQMTGAAVGFDHRPFVLNWVMSVKIIDGFVVNPIESLKAEWLYSQGRGRQFRVGEQDALSKYLSSVCPLSGEALENENERKLRLILSKAQQHQRQLQEQVCDPHPNSTNSSPSTLRRKGLNRVQSPRFSRLSGGRHKSPDSMSNSYHGSIMSNSISSEPTLPQLEMTKSLIENFSSDISQDSSPKILNGNSSHVDSAVSLTPTPPKTLSTSGHFDPPIITGGPLAAASKMVPVPESLMSPDCPTTTITQRVGSVATPHIPKPISTSKTGGAAKIVKAVITPSSRHATNNHNTKTPPKQQQQHSTKHVRQERASPTMSPRKLGGGTPRSSISSPIIKEPPVKALQHVSSDDDSENIQVEKLKSVRITAAEKSQKQKQNAELITVSKTTENSAILIQKIWRGYCTRKRHHLAEKIQRKKTQNYIFKLTKDMEETKTALENERKIQQLQMQAINSLWRKVSALQAQQQQQQQQFTPTQATTPSQALFEESLRSATVSLNFDHQSVNVVQDLTKTCSMLMGQVAQLQNSMQDMVSCLTMFSPASSMPHQGLPQPRSAIETQTEIIAVHTPQSEVFPFPALLNSNNNHKLLRPSSLPISSETSPKSLRLQESTETENTEKIVVQISELSMADDSIQIDNEPVSELESEKQDENEILIEMEKDETIADASSICTEN